MDDDTTEEVHHVGVSDEFTAAESVGEGSNGSAPEDAPVADYETAFVVLLDASGNAVATSDINALNGKSVRREANLYDLRHGCDQVSSDVFRSEIATQVSQAIIAVMPQALLQAMQMAGQQVAAARIAEGTDPAVAAGAQLLG